MDLSFYLYNHLNINIKYRYIINNKILINTIWTYIDVYVCINNLKGFFTHLSHFKQDDKYLNTIVRLLFFNPRENDCAFWNHTLGSKSLKCAQNFK